MRGTSEVPSPFLSVVGIAALLMSCNGPTQSGLPQAGHYEGSLIRRSNGALTEITVQATMTSSDPQTWQVAIQQNSNAGSNNAIEQDTVTVSSDGSSVALTVPSLALKGETLSTQNDCYYAADKSGTRVCSQSDAILIEVDDAKGALVYSLSLELFNGAQPTPVEKPQAYTLDQAMAHAFSTNFETQAQFERSMEASTAVTNAYMNLLPRLNINAATAAAPAFTDWTQWLSVVGDVAPFLLPTRWIEAKNADTNSDAEKLGLLIIRGDQGLEVESLAYSWQKDGLILSDYEDVIGSSQKLADQVRSLEALGEYPQGTADTIETSIDGMKADYTALSAAHDDERAAMAQALGFINPNAVTDLGISQLPAEPDLDQLTESQLEDTVVARSLELEQSDKLIEIAKNAKAASYFQWLDPSGDPNASLGFGLGSAVEIAQDHVDELETQRTQLEATVRQKARSAFEAYETAKQNAQLASADLTLQQKRLARILETVSYGKDDNQVELVSVYQDLLKALINSRNAQGNILVARAKLNRVLLEGYYSQLTFVPANPAPASL